MKVAELIAQVADTAAIEKGQAKKTIEAVFATITDAAKKGDEVAVPGFGKVKDSPARDGRNPKTGEAMKIAASRKLGFSAAKQVKDALTPSPG